MQFFWRIILFLNFEDFNRGFNKIAKMETLGKRKELDDDIDSCNMNTEGLMIRLPKPKSIISLSQDKKENSRQIDLGDEA